MAYVDFKNLNRRQFADNVLRNQAFNTDKNPKYNRYQRVIVSVVYRFFDKRMSGSGIQN